MKGHVASLLVSLSLVTLTLTASAASAASADEDVQGGSPLATKVLDGVGSQSWHLTDGAGCSGVATGAYGMVRGDGAGTTDLPVSASQPLLFCANEASLADVEFFGPFMAELVFREMHPFVNHTDGVNVEILCQTVLTTDTFTIRVGTVDQSGTFTSQNEVSGVRVCSVYNNFLQMGPTGETLVTLPLFTTQLLAIGNASSTLIVAEGEWLAMQLEKSPFVVPAVDVPANLVVMPVPSLNPDPNGPSIFVSPPTDPGYPIPELHTLLLSAFGLVGVGAVLFRKRRD